MMILTFNFINNFNDFYRNYLKSFMTFILSLEENMIAHLSNSICML